MHFYFTFIHFENGWRQCLSGVCVCEWGIGLEQRRSLKKRPKECCNRWLKCVPTFKPRNTSFGRVSCWIEGSWGRMVLHYIYFVLEFVVYLSLHPQGTGKLRRKKGNAVLGNHFPIEELKKITTRWPPAKPSTLFSFVVNTKHFKYIISLYFMQMDIKNVTFSELYSVDAERIYI